MSDFSIVILRADGLDFLCMFWVGGMITFAIGGVIALFAREWKVAGKCALGILIIMFFPIVICGAIALGVGKDKNKR